MATGYKITEQDKLYYLTFQIVGWVDIFTRKVYREIAIESLQYCQKNKGLEIFAYVIMSNHIHIMARSETCDLSGTIRDFKNFTSRKFLTIIDSGIESRSDWMKIVFEYHTRLKKNQTNQIWTHENHAEIIYSQKFIEQKIAYNHNNLVKRSHEAFASNPVRAGIVEKPEDYLYSSARNYAELENVLEIIKIDMLWKTIR